MKIGNVTLDSPFVLAPLAGVSDSPFRQLAREQGAGAVYTEMVSADGLVRGRQATFDYIAFEPHERPIGVQLFGSDPAIMADATRVLSDLPAERRPDLIDINMGCPVRKVVTRCAGAALLQDVPRIERIVSAMSAATSLPVTAKIRLGWDGDSRNVVDVARALEGAGASAVAIHARTRAEKFEGTAHWDLIGEAKRAVRIPVIGNGDVRTPGRRAAHARDHRLRRRDAGPRRVRRPVGVPPHPRARRARRGAAAAHRPERLEAGVRHLDMLVRSAGEQAAAREMRKHVAWYIKGLPNSARVREQVNRTRTAAEMVELMRLYLADLAAHGLEGFAPEPSPADAGSLRASG